MKTFLENRLITTVQVRTIIIGLILISCWTTGYLFGANYCKLFTSVSTTMRSNIRWMPGSESIPMSSRSTLTPFEGFNFTHLWSWRVADDNYYRLARLIPCRTINYTAKDRVEPMNTCDYSPNNEFSVANTVHAQKWLFEHQNPTNCTNKRFAIIESFAWSGFGSVIHQVLWAFGMALAEDRVAVYGQPGNWVIVLARLSIRISG